MAYILDANVFIEAKNRRYGLDFCPAFWEWLIEGNQQGKIISIEKVRDELLAGADELADWARQFGPEFYLQLTTAAITKLQDVTDWATKQGYEPSAVTAFLSGADLYLIAEALGSGHTVVTHEIPAPQSKKRIKIPDASCQGLGISCCRRHGLRR